MNLDERWVYRFIRTDLPEKQHSIQLGHAAWHAGKRFGAKHGNIAGIPFSVEIGVPNVSSLMRVARKLDAAAIEYFLFTDTDVSADPSALCTAPIDAAERNKYFANYRLYSPRVSSPGAVFNDERGASSHAAVAQCPQEHSPTKGEVASVAEGQRLHCFE